MFSVLALSISNRRIFFIFFFKVAAGREWYIHTIYVVLSKASANRAIGKRSLEYHHVLSPGSRETSLVTSKRNRRANPIAPGLSQDIGADKNRGTNIQHIALDRSNKIIINQKDLFPTGRHYQRPVLEIASEDSENNIVPVAGGAAGLLLLISTTIFIVFFLKRERQPSAGKRKSSITYSSSNETVTTGHSSSDSSEV